MIEQSSVSVTTTGSAGTATGSGVLTAMTGLLLDLWVNYHASAPGATTDVTITNTTTGDTILAITNNATDGRYAPRQTLHDSAGVALSHYGYWFIDESLTVTVGGCNVLTGAVAVTARYLRL